MNKSVRTILTVLGIVLIGYGVYALVAPEASIGIGDIGVEVQDNTNAYVAIALGILALAINFVKGK